MNLHTKFPTRPIPFDGLVLHTSHGFTRPIRIISASLQQTSHLARGRRITRRHVERGVLQKEIPRSQQHRHWFRGHDWVVFWRGEVIEAESVPEDYVCVVDGFVGGGGGGGGGDPFGEAAGGEPGCLGDVPAGGVELVVGVCGEGG